jgi:hypothetical protein
MTMHKRRLDRLSWRMLLTLSLRSLLHVGDILLTITLQAPEPLEARVRRGGCDTGNRDFIALLGLCMDLYYGLYGLLSWTVWTFIMDYMDCMDLYYGLLSTIMDLVDFYGFYGIV